MWCALGHSGDRKFASPGEPTQTDFKKLIHWSIGHQKKQVQQIVIKFSVLFSQIGSIILEMNQWIRNHMPYEWIIVVKYYLMVFIHLPHLTFFKAFFYSQTLKAALLRTARLFSDHLRSIWTELTYLQLKATGVWSQKTHSWGVFI